MDKTVKEITDAATEKVEFILNQRTEGLIADYEAVNALVAVHGQLVDEVLKAK